MAMKTLPICQFFKFQSHSKFRVERFQLHDVAVNTPGNAAFALRTQTQRI